VPDWRNRLLCSKCGSRNVDMVVSGNRQGRGFGQAGQHPAARKGKFSLLVGDYPLAISGHAPLHGAAG